MKLTKDGVYISLAALRSTDVRRVPGKIDLYILTRRVMHFDGFVLEKGTRYPNKKTKHPAYLGAFLLKKGRLYVGYDKVTRAIKAAQFVTGVNGEYTRKAELPIEKFVKLHHVPTKKQYYNEVPGVVVPSNPWEKQIRLIMQDV